MEHSMLNEDLMEVRGAANELQAARYAASETDRGVIRVIYVAPGLYQVALR